MSSRTGASAGATPAPAGRASRSRKGVFAAVLGAPLALWQGVFFVAPVVFMGVMTFWSVVNYQLAPDVSVESWRFVLGADYFWDAFVRSFVGAALAALLASVLSFPCAYFLALKVPPRVRLLGACLIMAPFFTSFLVRAYTWRTMLGEQGVVNDVLALAGIGPLQMTNNLAGTIVGYLTLVMPLVLLIQLFSIAGVDRRLIEAGHNLGCGALAAIFRVVVPAARNGIVLAAAFAFVLCFGDLISPQVLGGSNPPTLSTLLVGQVRGGLQWPRAAVIAVMMVAALVLVVSTAMAVAYGGRRRGR